jgi:hypothetical protein
LNDELFYANNTAATNTLINGTHHILRLTENTEWIYTNIFKKLEVNFRSLYHDLSILYRDLTNNQNIISRQISNVFIVLNRMYRGLNNSIIMAGANIINRIFESITITYQQLHQDAITNIRAIMGNSDNKSRNLTETITSNFNIMKINFQTTDKNDQMNLS